MSLQVDTFILGPLQTNTYVLRSGGQCWIVDPAMWPEPLLSFLEDLPAGPDAVLLTHGHADHIAGVRELKQRYPEVRVLCPAGDAEMLTDATANMSAPFGMSLTVPPADELIQPGDSLSLGPTQWEILDTSGHTPGGVSFHCAAERVVLTGDALFAGGIGRTDIPRGSARRLLAHIRENLLTLDESTRVLPGHGCETTIERELRSNPFFTAD